MAICLAFTFTASALDPNQSLYQLNCRTWARQNGVPASGVNSIAQTKDGYLWLGSAMGLVRFDGSEFKLFNLNHPEVSSTIVKSLSVSSRGGLWLGIERGAFAYCDGQKISFMGKDTWGGLHLNVFCVRETTNGDLWIAAETQTSRMSANGRFDTMMTGASADERYSVSFAYEGSQGRIWLGTSHRGLYWWQDGVITRFPDKTLNELNVLSFLEDRKGQLWVGTERGLICYDAKFQRQNNLPWPWYETRALLEDSHGVIWAGTSGGGLVRNPGGNAVMFQKTNGLADDFVTALHEDQEGSLWVGTRNGLSQLSSVKIPTFGKSEGLSPDVIVDITTSQQGGLWVGTSHGFARFNTNQTPELFSSEVGLANPYIKRLFEAKNGDLYLVNGAMDVEVFSDGKIVARYPNKTWPMAMTEDDQGIIVGVGGELFRAGVNYYEPYTFADDQKPSLSWIFNLCVGKDGTLWVACDNGICRIKNNNSTIWPVASKEHGHENGKVMWVFEDEDGTIWGGGVSGISRLKNDKVCTITRDHGLLDNIIYSIVPDNHGLFWVDSSRGIFSVSRTSLNDFADGKTQNVTSTPYDGLDAVKTDEKNQQSQSGCKTPDGRIWFPTSQGIAMIDPPSMAVNPIPPKVQIQDVKVNGRELDYDKDALVPPGQGELVIHYAGISFIAPEKIQYRYKLEGYDQDWVEAGTRRSVAYANLKPGKYQFLVQARGGESIWNEQGDSFNIELQPHFYQTIWFKVMVVAITVFAVVGAFAWRVKRLKWKQRQLQEANELLEEKVAKRTSELGNSNKSLLNEIEERKRAQAEVEKIHSQLMDASRRAGQAEVASNVLHNVGNVLNSVNVSTTLIAERLGQMNIENLGKAARMLEDHKDDPGTFLTTDPKGKLLSNYFVELSTHLGREQADLLSELKSLADNVSHIKEIVSMQQTYARVAGVLEKQSLIELTDAALKMHATAYARHSIKIVREYDEIPQFLMDKHKILQILVNIIHNAKYACDAGPNPEKIVTAKIKRGGESRVSVTISDNGMGIAPENLTRIFSHGYTTKKDGHGFGLHSAALAAKEMGGSLRVGSDGIGKGATFTLELPMENKDRDILANAPQGQMKEGMVAIETR